MKLAKRLSGRDKEDVCTWKHIIISNRKYAQMFVIALLLLLNLILSGCLSTTAKKLVPPPLEVNTDEVVEREQPKDVIVPVFYVNSSPQVDGKFAEWKGLISAEPYVTVYGGSFKPEDASGTFTLATDGSSLFIYAEIIDDMVNENPLSPAMAWRNDSVEIFFGIDTVKHTHYTVSDSHIRIVPVDRNDPSVFSLSINDIPFTQQTDAQVLFTENGYILEAEIDLSLLGINRLEPEQEVRVEFQINDGDETERDRMVHWLSQHDDPWHDPSVWADGKIVRALEVDDEK